MNVLSKMFIDLKNRHYFIIDVVVFLALPVIALLIRLDGDVDFNQYGAGLIAVMLLFSVVKLSIFFISGMYQQYWRYASIDEMTHIILVTAAAVMTQTVLFILLYNITGLPLNTVPRSIPLIDGLLTIIAVGWIRLGARLIDRTKERLSNGDGERVLIVGAGKAGITLAGDMQRNPQHGLKPIGLIDDNPEKLDLRIRGLRVLGDRTHIPQVVQTYNVYRVVIAIPSASGKDIRDMVKICKECKVRVSTLPSLFEIIDKRVRVDSLRDIQIDDLLRREPVKIDSGKVANFIYGKKVLVTGAGGSIGSEICRQIIGFNPSEVKLLGRGENAIFEIQSELQKILSAIRKEHPGRRLPKVTAFIADIRTHSRLEHLFESFQPDVIFHAAAHKHLPMMELNPAEAVSNNVLGARTILGVASKYDVKNFVMISTDKAVNPMSIMGASKRAAEILVLQAAKRTGNRYVCVRFGNVLGSRGRVVPIFQRQILNGGPVTVTHRDIRRYFMTIGEAVQLVLQSSVTGKSGEIFVLDMGEPIKIVDLAQELIRLSGLEVDKDIEIQYSGLRSGEKLFEELFIPGEEYAPTEHSKALIACNASETLPDGFDSLIDELAAAAERDNEQLIRQTFRKIIPEFQLPKFKNDEKSLVDAPDEVKQPDYGESFEYERL